MRRGCLLSSAGWIGRVGLWAGVSIVLLPLGEVRAGGARVVLVSIDGLRADAVSASLTPNLTQLRLEGSSTLDGRSQYPTFTVPNHVSMLTGLTPSTHGIVNNSDQGQGVVDNTVFELAREAGLSSGIYVSKTKLRLVARVGTYERFFATDDGTSTRIVRQWIDDVASGYYQTDLSFVHICDPDKAGHADGWMSSSYLYAVRRADAYVGRMLDTLESAGLRDETLVIVTSDHGGFEHNHSANRPEVTRVPWIAAGPGFPQGADVPAAVGTHDTAPTILDALGVEHGVFMEGVAVQRIFRGELAPFRRGDANADGAITLADAIHILYGLYGGEAFQCELAADVDDDDGISRRDALLLLLHLFRGRGPLTAPSPGCGYELSHLPCASAAGCAGGPESTNAL